MLDTQQAALPQTTLNRRAIPLIGAALELGAPARGALMGPLALRTAGPSASPPSRTVKPSTTPPARSRAMRFCTVPRDTPSRRASVALGIRLSARSSPISRWSRSSSGVI